MTMYEALQALDKEIKKPHPDRKARRQELWQIFHALFLETKLLEGVDLEWSTSKAVYRASIDMEKSTIEPGQKIVFAFHWCAEVVNADWVECTKTDSLEIEWSKYTFETSNQNILFIYHGKEVVMYTDGSTLSQDEVKR
jgi:hypothetical protein